MTLYTNKTGTVFVEQDFTPREQAAIRRTLEAGEPPLAPSFAAELFQLFLNGLTLEQIVHNHQGLRLGQVARAARDGEWHSLRREYQKNLLVQVRQRAQQSHAEAIVGLTQMIAMMNKRYAQKTLKFLQTGDDADLGELKDWGLPQFKVLIELFLKLTGQDGGNKNKSANDAPPAPPPTKVERQEGQEASPISGRPLLSGAPTSADAEKVLELLSGVKLRGPTQ